MLLSNLLLDSDEFVQLLDAAGPSDCGLISPISPGHPRFVHYASRSCALFGEGCTRQGCSLHLVYQCLKYGGHQDGGHQ